MTPPSGEENVSGPRSSTARGPRTLRAVKPEVGAEHAPQRPEHPPHGLPLVLSSFVGREREIAEIERLLGETRLLTLTGTGGCGKTRLALAVASDLVEGFEDG